MSWSWSYSELNDRSRIPIGTIEGRRKLVSLLAGAADYAYSAWLADLTAEKRARAKTKLRRKAGQFPRLSKE